jgi:hypothetical protein
LLSHAGALRDDVLGALAEGGALRRHPWVAGAASATLAAIAVHSLLRCSRAPAATWSGSRQVLAALGSRSFGAGPSWTDALLRTAGRLARGA